jgi:hypothetical protein
MPVSQIQGERCLYPRYRGQPPSRSPLIKQRRMGQLYFGRLPAKVGQLSSGVDIRFNSHGRSGNKSQYQAAQNQRYG